MRLHFSFIADALKNQFPVMRQTYGPSSDYSLRLSHPLVYRPKASGAPLGLGDLILALAEQLPQDANELDGCSVVCIGKPHKSYHEGSCDCVELADDVPIYGVFEALIDVYTSLEYWSERVRDTLICSEGLTDLFELYLEQLENPVFLTNRMHEIIVYVENPETVPMPDIYHFYSKDYANDDARENLMEDVLLSPMYESSFRTSGPQLWIDEVLPFDSLYCNVVTDGVFRGRILVDEQVRPFRISDYALLQMLHDDIVALMCRQPMLIDDMHMGIWKHLSEIIEGAAPDHTKLELMKHSAGWSEATRFLCLTVKLDAREMTIGSGHVNSALIAKTVPECRAFVFKGFIVAIIPQFGAENSQGPLPQGLLRALRDRLMKVGVSNEFSDLADISRAYRQAKLAIETGEMLGNTDWVFRCDDYFLPYMLSNCNGGLDYMALCNSRLQLLIDYDARKGLEYVKTLKCFVENNCSQVETSREMFLHRSTLLQRLKRVSEITELNLDDKKTRLYLQLFFAAIEQENPALLDM